MTRIFFLHCLLRLSVPSVPYLSMLFCMSPRLQADVPLPLALVFWFLSHFGSQDVSTSLVPCRATSSKNLVSRDLGVRDFGWDLSESSSVCARLCVCSVFFGGYPFSLV